MYIMQPRSGKMTKRKIQVKRMNDDDSSPTCFRIMAVVGTIAWNVGGYLSKAQVDDIKTFVQVIVQK